MPTKTRWMLFIAIVIFVFMMVLALSNKTKSDNDGVLTSKTTIHTIKALEKQAKELSWSIEYYADVHKSTLDILSGTAAKLQALQLQASNEQAKLQELVEQRARVQDTMAILLGTWSFM